MTASASRSASDPNRSDKEGSHPDGFQPGGSHPRAAPLTTAVPGTAGQDAERLPPARLAYDPRTWKEIAHLLTNLPMSLIGFTYVMTVIVTGAAMTVTVIGFPLLALGLAGARLLGRFERGRARLLLGVRIDEPSPLPLRRAGGILQRLWLVLKDPVAWRTVLYDLIRLPWGS